MVGGGTGQRGVWAWTCPSVTPGGVGSCSRVRNSPAACDPDPPGPPGQHRLPPGPPLNFLIQLGQRDAGNNHPKYTPTREIPTRGAQLEMRCSHERPAPCKAAAPCASYLKLVASLATTLFHSISSRRAHRLTVR